MIIQGCIAPMAVRHRQSHKPINLAHGYVGERSNRNPMEDPVNPYCKHPNLGSNFQQAHSDRPKRPDRQINGIPSIGALRLVNGPESVARWHNRRPAIRKPQPLNDHYLKDIGLNRSEIVSSAEEIIEVNTHLS